MDTLIVKIGGSVITDKYGRPGLFKTSAVSRILKDVRSIRRRWPRLPIILLHGAGSFGHRLAFRYRLAGGQLFGKRLMGWGETLTAMRRLTDRIGSLGCSLKLPMIPLQTAALAERISNQLKLNTRLITQLASRRVIPLLGGDVGVADGRTSTIISADELAIALAHCYHNPSIIFLTDSEGVYDPFPPQAGQTIVRRMSRRQLRAVTEPQRISRFDVTGGMVGKLRLLRNLRAGRIVIAGGHQPRALQKALVARNGTVITL